jgi:hypothetical protein
MPLTYVEMAEEFDTTWHRGKARPLKTHPHQAHSDTTQLRRRKQWQLRIASGRRSQQRLRHPSLWNTVETLRPARRSGTQWKHAGAALRMEFPSFFN